MGDTTITWILVCTLISNSAYAIIAPFLPLEFAEKGIEGYIIGIIFAVYSIAVIFFSPIVSNMNSRYGSSNLIASGILFMGITFTLFGTLDNMTNSNYIILAAIILRSLQGISSALIQTTCYCIATNDFPKRKHEIVGWVEAVTGMGCIVGPVLGSTLYNFLGFKHTFLVWGSFLIFLSLIIKLNFNHGKPYLIEDFSATLSENFLPMNQSIDQADEVSFNESQKVTTMRLLGHVRFFLAALSSALVYFMCCCLEPILATRLLDFDLTHLQIGLFFTIWSFTYIPSSIAVQYMSRKIEARLIIIFASFFCGISFFVTGPSQMLGLPDTLLLMGVGQAMIGVFTAIMIVPGLPEMVESMLPLYPGQEREVNETSSGIFNAFLGLG